MNTSSRRRERPSRLLRGTHAFLGCVAAFFLLASQVAAQNAAGLPEPLRGPPPVWAEPLPAPAVSTARSVGGFRILLNEQQLRFDAQGQHTYMRTVVHVQSAAGLRAASTISVSWLPAYQTLTLNSVTIRRGDEVIEALPFAQIEVLRREENLEFATLNGALTAVMQVAGVRVGDVLDIAYTLSTRVPVLGEHHELTTGVTNLLAMDRGRLRASWPADQNIRVRATAPWTTPEPRRRGDDIFVEIDENDVRILNIPQDAPPRYQLTRQLDFTDYADWDAVARLMAPLYAEAAILAPDSPLHAEVERIRAAWATPEEQALAALRLVQDEVRYVALAMGEAGLVPAGADETWRLRYGDCKGKTALLLALLRALGVEAEAALVSTVLGDGLSQRLPMVGAFDHVIVRAVIDGRVVWLDGTRMGDRRLDTPLTFGWALALDTGGDLQRIEVTPLATPLYESSLRVDASEGMLVPARISGSIIMRGDYALMMEDGLSSLTETGAGEFRQAMAKAMVPGLIVETVDSDYDAESNQFRITLTGTAPLDWRASGAGEAALYSVPLSAPGMQIGMNRASGPYADLPVTVNYPVYARQYVEVALPGMVRVSASWAIPSKKRSRGTSSGAMSSPTAPW